MFYYLSFLRPPPTVCNLTGSISITPQIANDLRTELYGGAQDIYYQWINSSSGFPLYTSTPILATRPNKLTTWRQSTAYKELTVPLPSGVKNGQAWTLVLTPTAGDFSSSPHPELTGSRYMVDLNDNMLGNQPFPVISMPISFGTNPTKGGSKGAAPAKQERIQRIYRLLPATLQEGITAEHDGSKPSKFSELIITEQTSFDLDKKIWDSGIGLSSWLTRSMLNPPRAANGTGRDSTQKLQRLLLSPNGLNVVELGAGTGIVAITLAALRSALVTNKADNQPVQDVLFTTDLASAMPLLEHNITSNKHLFPTNPPKAATLDWDDEILPEDIVKTLSGRLDIVIMADVAYNTDSFPSLISTIRNLIQLPISTSDSDLDSGSKPPIIILGYKERHSAERDLWHQIKGIGVELVKLEEREGAGEPPVEIWAYLPEH